MKHCIWVWFPRGFRRDCSILNYRNHSLLSGLLIPCQRNITQETLYAQQSRAYEWIDTIHPVVVVLPLIAVQSLVGCMTQLQLTCSSSIGHFANKTHSYDQKNDTPYASMNSFCDLTISIHFPWPWGYQKIARWFHSGKTSNQWMMNWGYPCLSQYG